MSDRLGMPMIQDSPALNAMVRQHRFKQEVANRFTYHPPKGDQAERYGKMRALALEMALELSERCPESRELSVAPTKLDEVVFWANAAIARNE